VDQHRVHRGNARGEGPGPEARIASVIAVHGLGAGAISIVKFPDRQLPSHLVTFILSISLPQLGLRERRLPVTTTNAGDGREPEGKQWRALAFALVVQHPPLVATLIATSTNPERSCPSRRPPEEWASSSKGPISNSDYLDSSPQTTIVSLSRSQSSVLDGLSPPPKSPGIHRPSMADFPPSPPAAATAATAAVDTPSWSGLQALVRRMPSASAATRWNRATEEWPGPLEACERDEIELEKQLWLLAELHRRDGAAPLAAARLSVPPASPAGWTSPPVHAVQRPGGGDGRVLDVCSRQADLVQLAALQPGARIAHLAPTNITSRDSGGAEATSPLPLPPNVASLSLLSSSPQDPPAFPLGDATLDHARVTPAAVGAFSGPQLMALLRECYRVLAVRGRLEVRMVDPAPCGGDGGVGPATARWVEAELLLALEARFRCTRPAALVPVWAREAGLELMTEGGGSAGCDHEFRVCVAEGAPPEERLEAELVRALLRSQYPFVKTWLWEVEECRAECLERATKFRVVSVFGLKT